MPDYIYPSILFETLKISVQQYTSVPQSSFSLQRLLDNLKKYWITANPNAVLKPKNLIVSDFTAGGWSGLKVLKVIEQLEQLCDDGFSIYVWQKGRVELLTKETLFYLRDPQFRRDITPAIEKDIIKFALQQLPRVSVDQLHVVDFAWINYFLSKGTLPVPPEERHIYQADLPDQLDSVSIECISENPQVHTDVQFPVLHYTKNLYSGSTPLANDFESLYIEGYDIPRFNTEGIHRLPNLASIQELSCMGSSYFEVEERLFSEKLYHLQKLQSFSWTGVQIPELSSEMQWPNLKHASFPLHIPQSSLVNILKNSLQLETLYCTPLSQETIAQLDFSALKKLVYSDRQDSLIKLGLVKLLAMLHKTPNLMSLTIGVCPEFTIEERERTAVPGVSLPNLRTMISKYSLFPQVLFVILGACEKLEHLDLAQQKELKQYDVVLSNLLECNSYLQYLLLPKELGPETIRTVLLHCHQLRKLTLPNCSNLQLSEQERPILTDLHHLEVGEIKFEHFNAIVGEAKDLKELVLENCLWHTSPLLFGDFPCLTKVTINGVCKIGKDKLIALLKNVEHLEMNTLTELSHFCSIPLPKLKTVKLKSTLSYSNNQLHELLTHIPDDTRIDGEFSMARFLDGAEELREKLRARGAFIKDDRPLHERFPIHFHNSINPTINPVGTVLDSSALRNTTRSSSRNRGGSADNPVPDREEYVDLPHRDVHRDHGDRSMDADTSNEFSPNPGEKQVFFAVHDGVPASTHHMRIDVYHTLQVNPAHCDIDHAFKLEKSGDPQIGLPEREIAYHRNEDVTALARARGAIAGKSFYYAKETFNLDSAWQAMPALTIEDVMTHVQADPDVEVQYSKRDNLYYIRAQSSKTCSVEWVIETPSRPRGTGTLPRLIQEEIARYNAFGEGALTINHLNPTGHDYWRCLEEQGKGACRHRACAFKAYMQTHYPDVQVRIVQNILHMWVEVNYDGQWITCDLGGYPVPNQPQQRLEQTVLPENTGHSAAEQQNQGQANTGDESRESEAQHDSLDSQAHVVEQRLDEEILRNEEAVPDAAHQLPNNVGLVEEQQEYSNPIDRLFDTLAQDIANDLINDYVNEISPQLYYEHKLATWSHHESEQMDSAQAYFKNLSSAGRNELVEFGNFQTLNAFSLSLEEFGQQQNRAVYYIDCPEDIRCSGPYLTTAGYTESDEAIGRLKRGPGGALHEFLSKHREGEPIIVVNYGKFDADDMVRLNSILDKHRRADSTPVPKNATVIGLLNVNKPNCYQGSDFYSRFHRVSSCPFSISELENNRPNLIQTIEQVDTATSIDLFHGADWESKLVGRWILNRGQFHFEKGELVKALERNEHHITIEHGLWEDPNFVRFWESLAINKTLKYADKEIKIPDDFVCLKPRVDAYDWSKLTQCIQRVAHEDGVLPLQVLNPGLLPQFFSHYACDNESESLYPTIGMIEAAQASGILRVKLTRDLGPDNWAKLLSACQKADVRLELDCPESFVLPWEAARLVSEPEKADFRTVPHEALKTAIISSTEIDTTVALMQQASRPWIVLDASEYEPADLLNRIDHKFDKAQLEFKFKQRDAALLTLLEEGKQVILKGDFSPDLSDHLAELVHKRLQSPNALGRLILIRDDSKPGPVTPKPVSMALPTFAHTVTVEEKLALLNLPENQTRLTPNQLQKESLSRLKTRLSQKEPWQGMEALRPNTRLEPMNWQESARIAAAFDDKRLRAVKKRLRHKAYVFLTGLTASGKTTFVERILTRDGGRLYRGEQSLKRWAQSKARGTKYLFLDEANFKEWSILEGLLHDPPGIVVDGTYYPLTPEHKIIFAGNPLNYGDERKLAKLFQAHGNALVFDAMPQEYIYERIIKPVFPEELLPLAPQMSAPWLEVYQFLAERSVQDVLISAREIQMMALLTLSYHSRNPDVPIEQVAGYYAHHIAKHLVPQRHMSSFLQRFPHPPVLPSLNGFELHGQSFKVTPSRQPLITQVTELLALRAFRRGDLAQSDAQRYGGLGGIVIEGESGIGKSELVTTLLEQCGYTETHYSAPMDLEGNRFYRLSVDMDMSQKIHLLHQAFHEGSMVVIDEINSSPMLERLLNSLLMGHTLKGERPKRPGFMVIGTQNPITLSGRRAPSNALSRRLLTVTLEPYPKEEMIAILADIIGEERAGHLVVAYEKQRAYALAHCLKPAPTFRDVIKIAQEEAGIQYTPARPLEEFDTELYGDEEDETDAESVVSDAADEVENEQDEALESDDSDTEQDEEIITATPVRTVPAPVTQLSLNALLEETLVTFPPPRGAESRNWSFYLLWLGTIVFAIIALLALCCAFVVALSPAAGLGPFAIQFGTALFMTPKPLDLSLCYAFTSGVSGLVAWSLFRKTTDTRELPPPPAAPNLVMEV